MKYENTDACSSQIVVRIGSIITNGFEDDFIIAFFIVYIVLEIKYLQSTVQKFDSYQYKMD